MHSVHNMSKFWQQTRGNLVCTMSDRYLQQKVTTIISNSHKKLHLPLNICLSPINLSILDRKSYLFQRTAQRFVTTSFFCTSTALFFPPYTCFMLA